MLNPSQLAWVITYVVDFLSERLDMLIGGQVLVYQIAGHISVDIHGDCQSVLPAIQQTVGELQELLIVELGLQFELMEDPFCGTKVVHAPDPPPRSPPTLSVPAPATPAPPYPPDPPLLPPAPIACPANELMQLVTVAQQGSSSVTDPAARVSSTGTLLLELFLYANSDDTPWTVCDETVQYTTSTGEIESKNGPLVQTNASYRCLDMPNSDTGYKPDGSVGTLQDYLYYLGLVQGASPRSIREADVRLPVCSSRRELHPKAVWSITASDCAFATSTCYYTCNDSPACRVSIRPQLNASFQYGGLMEMTSPPTGFTSMSLTFNNQRAQRACYGSHVTRSEFCFDAAGLYTDTSGDCTVAIPSENAITRNLGITTNPQGCGIVRGVLQFFSPSDSPMEVDFLGSEAAGSRPATIIAPPPPAGSPVGVGGLVLL